MTRKVSKALEEVWEWKEAVYEMIKDLSPEERVEFFQRESDRILKEAGLEKIPVGDGIYKLQKKKIGIVSEDQETYDGESE